MIWQKGFGVELVMVFVMTAVVTLLAVYQYRKESRLYTALGGVVGGSQKWKRSIAAKQLNLEENLMATAAQEKRKRSNLRI
jgi:hypothetical protein